jgi:PAS domain S-box-containing protein
LSEPLVRARGAEQARGEELERLLETFAGISADLTRSYAALAERAERVEKELGRANLELERRLAELDATRARLEAILAALPTGVLVHDVDGRVVRTNPAAERILGGEAHELVGRRLDELPVLREAGALDQQGGLERSCELTRPDGTRVVLATRTSPIRDARGAQGGLVRILDDRTELAELAERLHRADKMAALGTMAGGIAHEIRNPLNAIKGFAGLLRRELAEGTKAHRWASTISAGVDQVEEIVASMQTLARPERLRLERVEARLMVDEAVAGALSGTERPERWTIESALERESFRGDRVQLRQALRNLIANALQAQPEGGRVRVRLAARGAELALAVEDAGPGIPPALLARVADPFFTTRAEGTGLGLALVQTIASLHGGRLLVAPASPAAVADGYGGACASILLPSDPTS